MIEKIWAERGRVPGDNPAFGVVVHMTLENGKTPSMPVVFTENDIAGKTSSDIAWMFVQLLENAFDMLNDLAEWETGRMVAKDDHQS